MEHISSNITTEKPVESPWSKPAPDILRELGVNPNEGISGVETAKRRKQYGPNRLKEPPPKSAWVVLVKQFKSLIVGLLAVAAVLSFAFGDWPEGVAVLVVIAINTAIGFFTEIKAVRSMEALKKLSKVNAKLLRDGEIQEVHAEDIVPGDIVLLEGGDIVSADLRLFETSKLQADESTLTGESLPVGKGTETLGDDTPLAERTNMLFKGTAVTRGSGQGVVVATGDATELGEISSLVHAAEDESTPLEKRLDALGRKLIWLTAIVAGIVAATGIVTEKGVLLMVETGIALAVAAIPEGLPIVATIALARGVWRMAKRNALVNQLSSVETLGAVSVICTDKTGTLTENKMTVARFVLESGEVRVTGEGMQIEGEFQHGDEAVNPADDHILREALQIGLFCGNAGLQEDAEGGPKGVGDPMEVALLVAAAKAGMDREKTLDDLPEEREEAFDNETNMMATFHRRDAGFMVAVKGAPESVIGSCDKLRTTEGERPLDESLREEWLSRSRDMAKEGLRILGLATKQVDSAEAKPYEELTLIGLVALVDPPRRDVRDAIEACHTAGIRVVMVTGDQAVTARYIGREVGLIEPDGVEAMLGNEIKGPDTASPEERERLVKNVIFSRVTPRQKLDLIALHQSDGSIVAMTGDGVNDAPALKKADIGVAMGLRGTQVAKEASDVVLKDDAFATIVAAVAQGRVIYSNIRKFVFFLLSCNLSEIMVVFLAAVANAPLPLLPLQILFLNLVTDVFPALALGMGEGDPDVLKRSPRDPNEPIVGREHWVAIAGYSAVITASVLGALALALYWLKLDRTQAVTISFLTLAFAQLWHVFNMRDPGSGFFRNDIVRNPYIWGALLLCSGAMIAAVYMPGVNRVLNVTDPGLEGWALVLIMSLIPLVLGQVAKLRGAKRPGLI
jgi:Ca2+-transporting ATPase